MARLQNAIPILCAAGLILAAGCGPKKAQTSDVPVDAPAPPSPTPPPSQSSAPAPAPAAEPAPIALPDSLPTTPAGSKSTEVHQDLTAALHRYFQANGRLPATFELLAQSGFIKPMPAPPAGKKFALDRQTLQVVVIDQ